MTINAPTADHEGFIAELDAALDEMRPYVESHGGVLNFIEWLPDEGRVKLQLAGNCHGCPMSMVTIKLGIERILQDRFPQVMVVEAIRVDDFDYPEIQPLD
jgi:Fe-S cluster biogenesis protein NfuA